MKGITGERRRIAVVTPLPVSGIEGGNERHWRSLTAALNDAGHDARLVAEVSPEANLREVLASYAMFHAMDLSDVDVVISGKYPSFMVRHPCHIRHLNHPLRGLYEHYPTNIDTAIDASLRAGIDACGNDVDELIGWADRVAVERAGDLAVAFPGPFARAVVHRLDRIGRDRLTAEATVSETVANRPDYVDPDRPITIIPPLGDLVISNLEPGDLDVLVADVPATGDALPSRPFLFTFGRLDRAKRFDLIMRAFGVARRLPGMGDVPLVVAGDGPLRDELTASAGHNVHIVGRLDDDALASHLRAAAAVVLAPIDEDYGLVAAEAMAAGTPVITTSDSGGIAEQIRPGRDGLVVHPRVPLLAAAMRDLATRPDRAARLGRAAQDAVRPLSWSPMLSLIAEVSEPQERRRVLLVSTFPADPVESGGQRRLRGMAAGLATLGWRPTVLSLTNRLAPGGIRRRRTPDGVRHVMVGRSQAHLRADFAMASLLGSPIDDVAAAELWPSSPAFSDELRAQAAEADIVVLSHPFLVSALADLAASDQLPPVVYDAFNVETDLKREVFADREGGSWVAERAAEAETAALELAAVVSATSDGDLDRFRTLHGVTSPTAVAVNPLAAELSAARSPDEHRSARRRFMLDLASSGDARPITLFMGSDHPPNRAAARRCVALAAARPDLHVVIAGTVNVPDIDSSSPARPTVLGSFAARDLRRLLTMADVVLNPIETGSGTSLKLIDPLSLGIPVVSTALGARGLPDPDRVVWLSGPDPDELGATIDLVLADPESAQRRSETGRAIARRALPENAMSELSDRMAAVLSDDPDS